MYAILRGNSTAKGKREAQRDGETFHPPWSPDDRTEEPPLASSMNRVRPAEGKWGRKNIQRGLQSLSCS